ncbi:nicotinate mononucleotide-dependent phosphoribosyltransferase CobT [Oscillatoria sp. FACHB-1406]|uniref:nicotinate mononucleotide-dependent phosphoribosyltransferase CobT n=1 Tax=Oscillatoria sp. FACHB-1406 TaxID=2692846 RepID=UPI0016896034|nr:TIGR00303 family protein [Oscillatoria sp. FACHB-1406]MBD2580058.1 TIGR00303 family protein [Oscillatoria sp. FACHB-1406]
MISRTIQIYTQLARGQEWLRRQQNQPACFACILGFTATGLIEGISAAGATPEERKYTAIADAEFLIDGPKPNPKYPLPSLERGLSPVLISRAAIAVSNIPVHLFDAGLPVPPAVSAIDLQGMPADCVSTGRALPRAVVDRLFEAGLQWGENLSREPGYLIIGECVVGGTTTALGVLTGLGIDAVQKISSSQHLCDRNQKWTLVQQGLTRAGLFPVSPCVDPLDILAAVGDPMQVAAAGMAIAASRRTDVLLAGGTQMLAVYAAIAAIARLYNLAWEPDRILVGTTRWVAEDTHSDAVGLALAIREVPLIATQLNFTTSRYPQLSVYEQGYVKEGVGAGGCAIATHLNPGLTPLQLLAAIESLIETTYSS